MPSMPVCHLQYTIPGSMQHDSCVAEESVCVNTCSQDGVRMCGCCVCECEVFMVSLPNDKENVKNKIWVHWHVGKNREYWSNVFLYFGLKEMIMYLYLGENQLFKKFIHFTWRYYVFSNDKLLSWIFFLDQISLGLNILLCS